MAQQIYLLVDSANSSAVVQAGQPPTNVGAWGPIDVPGGQTAEQVAESFFQAQRFPLGSAVYVVDAASVTKYVATATLSAASG